LAGGPDTTVPRSFEWVEGWGMAVGARSRVLRPASVDGIREAYATARRDGVPLGLRGTGNSYGDASVNATGHVLDCSRMNRILGWDARTGVAELEPGVTVEQLWKRILPEGWWPRVVSGTMFPTMAGALAMNIHGKNNFTAGTFGDATVEFDLVLPGGELLTCNRERNAELFHAAIGGFGMLGAFSRVVLRTHRVHSGELLVQAMAEPNLRRMLATMEAHRGDSDYLVGWIDAFAEGEAAGRGLIHRATYLREGEDRDPAATLAVRHQELPANILGVIPKAEVWRLLAPFNNDTGMRLINGAKFLSGQLEARRAPHRQSHAAFAFLLDYVPNWKWAYGRTPVETGLIQFQAFVPHATAEEALGELLSRSRRHRIVPYLGVLKRHRPDPFLMTHGLDGWSLAMDFKVSPRRREALWRHCAALTEIVLAAGGRFYFAKDLVIGPRDAERAFPPQNLQRFLELKRTLDPGMLLQTNLYRRIFGGLAAGSAG